MSDIESCLATFAVSAWANDDLALERAERVIDAYLATVSGADHEAALLALQAACEKMPSDSYVAAEIRARIERRISALLGPCETRQALDPVSSGPEAPEA